jgi:hypothetical protein
MRNAIILQQAYTPDTDVSGLFSDMLRLTMQRHAAYARAHQMDYVAYFGDYCNEKGLTTGGWHKIKMILDCLERGYEYVFWIDTDAAVVDFEEDLREAFTDKFIGCCEHNANNIAAHLNVGVTFVRNGDGVKEFMREWWDAFPGDKRWMEQGAFNDLTKKYPELVFKMDDRYNATVNVNMVDNPVIIGWHGLNAKNRIAMMKKKLLDDHIRFRV